MVAVVSFSAMTVAASCGSCGVGKKKAGGECPDVALEDLKAAITAGKVTVIDVNGTKSYKKGHIPGALDFQALGKEGLAKALPEDKGKMVVVYCGGPKCSAYKKGAIAAQALGYTDVHHFSGGLSGWKQAGEKLEPAE